MLEVSLLNADWSYATSVQLKSGKQNENYFKAVFGLQFLFVSQISNP